MNKLGATILFSLLVLLAGCKEQAIHSGLSEQEVNEMVAVLQKAGLSASKLSGKDNSFTVSTTQEDFADAVMLLQATGLPRPKFDDLGGVFKDQSFVSSNMAQRARYMHALTQEISHTISSIDGVLLARVHLAVPERDPLSEEVLESSASVFIKHRPDIDLSMHVGQIKALVINGLENLPYDNVTVALFEAEPSAAENLASALAKPANKADAGAPVLDSTAGTKSGSRTINMGLIPTPPSIVLIGIGLVLLIGVVFGWAWTLRGQLHAKQRRKPSVNVQRSA